MFTPIRTVSAGAALSAFALFTALSVVVGPVQAQRQDRQGKEVVDAVCGACHLSGKDHAPRIGDARAWSARGACSWSESLAWRQGRMAGSVGTCAVRGLSAHQ